MAGLSFSEGQVADSRSERQNTFCCCWLPSWNDSSCCFTEGVSCQRWRQRSWNPGGPSGTLGQPDPRCSPLPLPGRPRPQLQRAGAAVDPPVQLPRRTPSPLRLQGADGAVHGAYKVNLPKCDVSRPRTATSLCASSFAGDSEPEATRRAGRKRSPCDALLALLAGSASGWQALSAVRLLLYRRWRAATWSMQSTLISQAARCAT